jgi:Flp pilus assembly protein TadB
MPSKKQRRRREKERRHEYEYVYIDEEGNEVEAEPPAVAGKSTRPASKNGSSPRAARSTGSGGPARVMRPVQPPSFRYLRKQGIIFFGILAAAFLILPAKGMTPVKAVALAAIYAVVMLPFLWLMQRAMYRLYLRRTGQLPTPGARKPDKPKSK